MENEERDPTAPGGKASREGGKSDRAAEQTSEIESEGRKPPSDDLQDDPAYEPDEPLKGIKGG